MIHAYNDMGSDYGIPCGETSEFKVDEPPQHFSGTVIVTASALAGILNYTGGARTAAMFRNLQPKAKLGGSALFVYEGDFDLQYVSSLPIMLSSRPGCSRMTLDQPCARRKRQSPSTRATISLISSCVWGLRLWVIRFRRSRSAMRR